MLTGPLDLLLEVGSTREAAKETNADGRNRRGKVRGAERELAGAQ